MLLYLTKEFYSMTQQDNEQSSLFNLQPRLDGKLITLKPLSKGDFELLYQAASDPLIWEQHPAKNRCERDVFEVFFAEAIESGGALLICDKASGEAIGSSRYFGFNSKTSDVEIGWTFLARKYWGGEYNGELKRLMLDHAFQFVDTVKFMVDPVNTRSQKAVEKIGGVQDPDLDDKGRVVFRVHKT